MMVYPTIVLIGPLNSGKTSLLKKLLCFLGEIEKEMGTSIITNIYFSNENFSSAYEVCQKGQIFSTLDMDYAAVSPRYGSAVWATLSGFLEGYTAIEGAQNILKMGLGSVGFVFDLSQPPDKNIKIFEQYILEQLLNILPKERIKKIFGNANVFLIFNKIDVLLERGDSESEAVSTGMLMARELGNLMHDMLGIELITDPARLKFYLTFAGPSEDESAKKYWEYTKNAIYALIEPANKLIINNNLKMKIKLKLSTMGRKLEW